MHKNIYILSVSANYAVVVSFYIHTLSMNPHPLHLLDISLKWAQTTLEMLKQTLTM